MKTLILVLLLVTGVAEAQLKKFGSYATFSTETFYKKNIFVSSGVRFKDHRVGFFYQQAFVPIGDDSYYWHRKGIYTDFKIGDVDEIMYFFVGLRTGTSNDEFFFVMPHFLTSFRATKNIEFTIMLSRYASKGTGSVGVRFNM